MIKYSSDFEQLWKIYPSRASTFFGAAGEAWLETWAVPKPEVKETNEQKGRRLNMPAKAGESMDEWQRRIAQAR